jgi:hypothetical protein
MHARVRVCVHAIKQVEIVDVKLVHQTCFAGQAFQCYTYNFFGVLNSA